MNLSTIFRRFVAFSIDDLLMSLIFIFIYFDKFTSGDYELIMQSLKGSFYVAVFLNTAYQTFFVYYYGATLGKMMFKIKVVNLEFQRVSFSQALIRGLVRSLISPIFYLGFIIAFFSKYKQTLHDKLAQTLVIKYD